MRLQFFIGLMILILATCSIKQPSQAEGGLEGQSLIVPLCPTVQNGQTCPDQPYQAMLTVNNTTGTRITQVQTDTQGRFKIPLAPGTYALHPESPNLLPHANDQTFTVEAGRFTQVTVEYDSGIR